MKVSKLLARFMFLASVCIAASSCGNDDETNVGPGGDTPAEKPTHAFVYYQFAVTKDLKSAVDVKAVYTNENGLNDTVAVNDTAWSKVIRVSIPYSGKVKAVLSKKTGFEPDRQKYRIGITGTTSYNYENGNSFHSSSVSSSTTVSAQNLDGLIDIYLSRPHEWTVDVK